MVRNDLRKRCLCFGLLSAAMSIAVASAGAQQPQPLVATAINLSAADQTTLGAALRARGFTLAAPPAQGSRLSGQVVVLEANGALTPAMVESLRTFVQQGGSLLVGLDEHAGTAPAQLSFLMPTTAWITQAAALSRSLIFNPVVTGEADAEFFHEASPGALELPYFFPVRPVSAVERGVARYDRYKSEGTPAVFDHGAGQFFWTRPLLNRDWRVRLSANDRAASPLLITGRFGAGRVAVFASTLTSADPAQAPLWKPIVSWLSEGAAATVAKEPAPDAVEVVSIGRGDADTLAVTLHNRTGQMVNVQMVSRLLTWEEAYLGDATSSVTIQANGTTVVNVPLPKVGPLSYQALEWRRAFVVRVGVLSSSGATLLAERVTPVDETPAAGLDLATDNLYRVSYPYPAAPGIETLNGMQSHMGLPVMQYAYLPGSAVHATATLSNGVHNIAALAHVSDETTPGNASVFAINDLGARYNKPPRGGLEAFGTWNGRANADNVLTFKFPSPVTITAVTLIGSGAEPQRRLGHNPGAVVIECDGKKVAQDLSLDERFVRGDGLARLAFEPVQASVLTVRMPWVAAAVQGDKREAPALGEIEVEGSETALPDALHGEAQMVLRDSLSGSEVVIATKAVQLAPGARVVWTQGFQLPKANHSFYQLQLRFSGQTRTVPILALQPEKTLTSVMNERPHSAPTESFVVTHGFRNLFPLGSGTQDYTSPWGTPDDLVFAYSRQLKQVSSGAVFATELFAGDSDLRHYSTPWSFFPDGESILALGTKGIVEGMKRQRSWATSDRVTLGFGDRWDSGPSLEALDGWQVLVAFDDWLRAQGKPALEGRTHADLLADVRDHHGSEWALWHEHRYVVAVDGLRAAFAAEGKQLNMSGQGIPMASNEDATILAKTIKGMASDSTWGMDGEDVPLTTGRQLADQAFNPEWKLDFNLVWGYDSTTLQNGYWYGPVGTTEPSRRHYYDSAWRGIVGEDGEYRSSYAYGYGNNGGEAWTMAANDYQQAWNAQERFSLLYPEHPLGAGLLVSSAPVDSPTSTLFSGGGMGPDGKSEAMVHRVATAFERLHNAGVSIPYSANIRGVSHWGAGSSFILEDMGPVTDAEVALLKAMASRGARFVVFAGAGRLTAAQAELLGLNTDGTRHGAAAAGTIAAVALASNGNFLSIPVRADQMSPELGMALAPTVERWLQQAITFPEGTMGYGFKTGPQTMLVLEDWKEQARVISVRVRASATQAHAAGLNDHSSLVVERDGPDWVIKVPMRPGDGEVVVLEQSGPAAVAEEHER